MIRTIPIRSPRAIIALLFFLSACNFTTKYHYDVAVYQAEPFVSYQNYAKQHCQVDFDGLVRYLHHSMGYSPPRGALESKIMEKRGEISRFMAASGSQQDCFFERIATSSIPIYYGPYVDFSTYYELWIQPDADGTGRPLLCLGLNPLSDPPRVKLDIGPPADRAFPRGNPMPEGYRRGPAERERYLPICITSEGERHGHLEDPNL